MRRILVGVGAFELEVSQEGACIFLGSVLADSSETVARFHRPSWRKLGQVTLRLMREWKRSDLDVLGGCWDILLPLAAPEGNLQLQAAPFGGFSSRGPVGARVWPCSLLVTAYIRRLYAYSPDQLQTQLLELGSGSGLCGLVAAAHGATVVLSDGDARVLPLLNRNVADYARRHHGPRPQVLRLDFSGSGDVEAAVENFGRFDIVIASDVLYEHRLVSPFFRSAIELLRPPSQEGKARMRPTMLVAAELRPCGVDLAMAIQNEGSHYGFAVTDVTDQMQLWVVTPPEELQVPPLEQRHRLYVISSQASSTQPVQRAEPRTLRPHQPWQKLGNEEWYSRSLSYWSHQEASCTGVLGGHPETSQQDLAASEAFLDGLGHSKFEAALDCGAGIGRITEGLLLHRCEIVDLLEPSPKLLEEARSRLLCEGLCKPKASFDGQLGLARNFIQRSLQNLCTLPDCYDLIWVQWVLLYLTDADVVEALQCLHRALRPSGVIVVKENCLLNNSPGLLGWRGFVARVSSVRGVQGFSYGPLV